MGRDVGKPLTTDHCPLRWALQAAEKRDPEGGRGPQRRVFVAGVEEGGFNPRIKPTESTLASATEGHFAPIPPKITSFSAAYKAPEACFSAISTFNTG
jgi:hypothetical protein